MNIVDEVEKAIPSLPELERKRLARIVLELGDEFPLIESREGICGGVACVVRTRIPVWVLEQSRRLGISEGQLVDSFPSLRAEDVKSAWAYACAHKTEIDQQIRDNEAA